MAMTKYARGRRSAARPHRKDGTESDDPVHIPVLLAETLAALAPMPGGRYVDGTVGLGGHAAAVLEASAPDGTLIGIDADPDARACAAERLSQFGERVQIVAGNARALSAICTAAGWDEVDGVLLDLGVSSLQLGPHGRGFSFQHDAPLDMRMDPTLAVSAATIVNQWDEAEIARVLYEYGEEPRSRRIARAIVAARPLISTQSLASVVARAIGTSGRPHPATRTFQALRIAVNDEYAALRQALAGAVSVLRRPGGRLAVISFHSGEDRIVKDAFRAASAACVCPPRVLICACRQEPTLKLLSRRIIAPSAMERERNPRSRSAKLRVAERLAA